MTISIPQKKKKLTKYFSKSSFTKNLKIKCIFYETFVEFCNGTNLHGFRQIVEEHKDVGHPKVMQAVQRISSIMWTIFVIINVAFAIYLFEIVLQRYRVTPTITIVQTTTYPISEIKYPGIAICNVNAVWKPNTIPFIEKLSAHNVSKELIGYFFGNLSSFVNFEAVKEDLFPVIDILDKHYGYTVSRIMKELAMPCDKFMYMCYWLDTKVNCSSIFRMERTDLGFCCAFNYKGFTEEDKNSLNSQKIPDIHIGAAGEDYGLKVLIDIDPDNYVAARKFFYGSEIIVFDSEIYPQKHFISNIVQQEHGVAIGIKPSLFATNEDVQTFAVELRECLYDYERQLAVTPTYSFDACIVQCRAMETIKRCNCLPFMYPQVVYPNSNGTIMRQCQFRDLACLKANKHVFFSIKPPKNMYAILNISKQGLDCECLPSCHAMTYDNEIYPIDRYSIQNIKSDIDNPSYINRTAMVNVFYKYMVCTRYLRRIFMTWDDLLGSFGGIFGLCLGASVFSIVEIGYYFTVVFIEKWLFAKVELDNEQEYAFAKGFMIQYCKPYQNNSNEFDRNEMLKKLQELKGLDDTIKSRKSIHSLDTEREKY